MFRPRHVLERAHGNIPESTRWLDWFDWDVDSFEFQTPADMHRAFKADPSRFEFVDIYSDARTALNKMMASTAEVLVIHMYVSQAQLCIGVLEVPCVQGSTMIRRRNDEFDVLTLKVWKTRQCLLRYTTHGIT